MARKFDSNEWKEELTKRAQESDERKEGEGFQRYFKDDIELTFAKFGSTKDLPHIIDIIPFRAGDKMPNFMRLKEGKPAYYLDIYVHQNIGPMKSQIVCLAKNYGLPCPICEHIDDLAKSGKEYEDYADIAPKRRCVYNIINMTSDKEERKGIQIWEASRKYSEQAIANAAKNPRGGAPIAFAHWDKEVGQSISFSVDADTYKTISGHKLVPRDYDISQEILDAAHQLDQIITILSYDEIKKIAFRASGEDAHDAAQDDVKNFDEDIPRAARGVDSGQARTTSKTRNECPADGKFGEDIDKLQDCEDCKVYAECAARNEELEKERQRARASKIERRR